MKFQISVYELNKQFVADCFLVVDSYRKVNFVAFHSLTGTRTHDFTYSEYQDAYDWLLRHLS